MWKKTLLAAAVAGLSLPTRAADPAEAPPPTPPPPANSDNDDTIKLDEIVVEGSRISNGFKAEVQSGASRLPLTLRETPQSVTVLTRESLDRRQVMNLKQALELSAGTLQFSGNGPFAGQPSFGFNQTTIRGIAIDDLYDFRDDGFVSGSYYSIPDLAIYDRIEVVKGPNSVLYGRGSVGGLINRVRKQPLADFRADLEVNAGSFDTYRTDVDVTGPLFDSKSVRGRVVGAYEDSGSFVDGVETQRSVLAPSIDLDLSAGTRLKLQALYQSEDIIPNTGTPLRTTENGLRAPNISRRQYIGVVTRKPYTWETQSASAQLEQDLGDQWLLTLRLSSSRIDTPIKVDAYAYTFNSVGDDPETPEVERIGDTFLVGNQFDIERDIWSGELQLNGAFNIAGRAVKATFGADVNENDYFRSGMYTDYLPTNIYDGNFTLPDPALNPGATFGGDPRSTGFYAQAQVIATERLKVLLGARYDEVKLRSFNGSGVDRTTDSDTVSDVTGRIGLSYDVSKQISVYSLYSQSFQPVLFDLDINGNLLDPETGNIYELGAKTEWFDGRLGINTALYRVERDNIPIAVDAKPPYSISSGVERTPGFEIEINGQPLKGWNISTAYNRADSDFAISDWQFSVYTDYEIQGGPLRGLGFGLTGIALDERRVNLGSDDLLPGYERLDLHAFYHGWKRVEVNLVVRNVTDEVYIEGADRSSGYATFGSPAAALLSLRYTLGGS